MKKNVIFVFVMIFILLVLFAISRKKFPTIQGDKEHLGITDTEICIGCHGPEESNPMKDSHPPKFKCFKCHEKQEKGVRVLTMKSGFAEAKRVPVFASKDFISVFILII